MIFIENQKTQIFKNPLSCCLETVTLLMCSLLFSYACILRYLCHRDETLLCMLVWTLDFFFFSLSNVYAHILLSVNSDIIQNITYSVALYG